MLKRLFVLTFAVALGMSLFARAAENDNHNEEDEHILPTAGDSWTPWPWTLAKPFPWADIEGSWKVKSGDFISYFSLRIANTRYGRIPQLAIRQYDGVTCRMLSTGVGLERNQKIYAQMTATRSGRAYRVHFTAFDEKDSPLPPLQGNIPTERMMVVSMGPLDNRGDEGMSHMQIVKVSELMSQEGCLRDQTGNN